MRKIGLGLIGLGSMGSAHLQNCQRLQNAHLVAVADTSKRALKKAEKSGVKKTFNNYEDLLKDSEIDAVIISVPTHLHLRCAEQAAEAGKDILLEKPIARNVEEAKALVLAAQKNSAKLMIGYPLHFNETYRHLKRRMENGELGEVEVAYATNIGSGPFVGRTEGHTPTPVPDWWFNKELTGGGVLMDLGSHMINLLQWYFGSIVSIKSNLGYRFNLDVEDSAVCFAKFGSGTRALISLGWFSQSYQLRVELTGTVGNVVAQELSSNPLSNIVHFLTRKTTRFLWSYLTELEYFTTCLIRDVDPSPSGEDGLKDLEAISLAYKNSIL